jgi:16S rRNA (guanine527-N7)-methyltransferase
VSSPRVAARLAALVTEYGLAPSAGDRLARLLDLLEADPHAPTSVRAAEAAVDVHVADSLSGLRVAAVAGARHVADLGAGAGFPGLVLAIARPEAHVDLVESGGRKCAFLERAVAAAAANAAVVHARAETWAPGLGACDAVTARALAALPVLVEYAAPLLRVGGALVAWRGERDRGEETEGAAAAATLGLAPAAPVGVHPFRASRHRHLHVYVKVRPTPAGYPRRPGMAVKRPLGARGRPG